MKSFFSLLCLEKKFLVRNFVMRNIKIKYRESFLGYLWTMAIPACQVAIFYFLYSLVFKVNIPHYLIFLISGLLPWIFFSTTVSESMESVSGNAGLLNQMPIPIQAFPNASAQTNMINFLAALPVIIIVYAMSGLSFHWKLLLVIPLLVPFYLMALSVGIIFSIFYIYFRDLRHVSALLLQIWFYITPVVYHIEQVPLKLADLILKLNPAAGFFIVIRNIVFDQQISLASLYSFLIWTVICLGSAILILDKISDGVVERL